MNELLEEGAISIEEFEAAGKKAYDELVEASDKWFDGAKRALDKYAEEATDMAANVERVVTNAMQGLEDALVKATTTGKFEFRELVDSILEDIARLLIPYPDHWPVGARLKRADRQYLRRPKQRRRFLRRIVRGRRRL